MLAIDGASPLCVVATSTSVNISAPELGSWKLRNQKSAAESRLFVVLIVPASYSERGESAARSADQSGWLYLRSKASATPTILGPSSPPSRRERT